MSRFILLIILVSQTLLLSAQPTGFFKQIPYSDTVNWSIKYHIKLKDDIIYILNKFVYNNLKDCKASLVKEDYGGEVKTRIDLGVDSLNSFSSYGENLDDKIQTFCFASKDNRLYLIYQLFNHDLNELSHNVVFIDTFDVTTPESISFDMAKYKLSNGRDKNYIILSWYPTSWVTSYGMVFDSNGMLQKIKHLEKNIGVTELDDGVIYDYDNKNIVYVASTQKYIFDDDLNYIKTVKIPRTYPIVNDTTFSIFSSIIDHNNKHIRMGLCALEYNKDKDDEYYYIVGRGIGEVDNNLRVKGRINLTPMPVSAESDGVARLSSSVFYKDGYYYTLFEYQDEDLPLPSATTFYLTKFDTLFNIVEETHYMVAENYRFFIEWVDFSDDLQLSASGFYYHKVNGWVNFGTYILAFNLDGSMPTLSNKATPILASITIKGNPTSDYLTLSSQDIHASEYEVRLYNLQGRLLRTDDLWEAGTLRVPVYDLP
ncbi:MAG: hypothetical protein J5I59_03715, partial [Saprospiraceae bacterium]|nr:hypothetical protein [Saprospiraceae bacterium]